MDLITKLYQTQKHGLDKIHTSIGLNPICMDIMDTWYRVKLRYDFHLFQWIGHLINPGHLGKDRVMGRETWSFFHRFLVKKKLTELKGTFIEKHMESQF